MCPSHLNRRILIAGVGGARLRLRKYDLTPSVCYFPTTLPGAFVANQKALFVSQFSDRRGLRMQDDGYQRE